MQLTKYSTTTELLIASQQLVQEATIHGGSAELWARLTNVKDQAINALESGVFKGEAVEELRLTVYNTHHAIPDAIARYEYEGAGEVEEDDGDWCYQNACTGCIHCDLNGN